jgi:3,4-dihydroxy 2-butanone 4-phosphate synthase / GTP cyclohydrolase II
MPGTLQSHARADGDAVFVTVEQALDDLRQGRFVILVDGRAPDSEGDLLVAAEQCTPEAINFMATEASGVVFLCLPEQRVEELGLRRMAPHGDASSWKRAMTVSIEARSGVTTGISARDRARTVQVAIDPASGAGDLVCPGHIFPLAADDDGVFGRLGRTEAHVDLARLAGFIPAAVIAEAVTEDGSDARGSDLVAFARRHAIRMVAVGDVAAYRLRTERVLAPDGRARLRTRTGAVEAMVFTERPSGLRHLAIVHGSLDGEKEVSVHVHAECFAGDVLGSAECECRDALDAALRQIAAAPRGLLVYVRSPAPSELGCGPRAPEHAAAIAAQVITELGIAPDRVRSDDPATTTALERAR